MSRQDERFDPEYDSRMAAADAIGDSATVSLLKISIDETMAPLGSSSEASRNGNSGAKG
jgi:hypothetical protein